MNLREYIRQVIQDELRTTELNPVATGVVGAIGGQQAVDLAQKVDQLRGPSVEERIMPFHNRTRKLVKDLEYWRSQLMDQVQQTNRWLGEAKNKHDRQDEEALQRELDELTQLLGGTEENLHRAASYARQ